MKFKNSLFIFRRDYRIVDNYGLIECCKNSENVYPIFIFTPEQIDDKKNKYKSNNSVQFLVESLRDLKKQIQKQNGILGVYYGEVIDVLDKLTDAKDFDAIYVNEDYTPYSKKRDLKIKEFCDENTIIFNQIDDMLLYPVNKVFTDSQKPYTIFTPYMKKAKELFNVKKPKKIKNYNFSKQRTIIDEIINDSDMNDFYKENKNIKVRGGRALALKIFKNIVPTLKDYNKTRDIPTNNNTNLSAYIRFGCVSLRECYWTFRNKLGKDTELITQMYWFCFYTELGMHFPDMYSKRYLTESFKDVKWDYDKKLFNAWTSGKTGYPLSDAGMREMNKTGFMHNRVRMVSATLLSRILMLDWRMGEQYFSKKLVDHLRSNNDGNWFWVIGTAPHSQVYFRVMSEKSQIERFDKQCKYIKEWIPELKDIPPKDILNWDKKYKDYPDVDYPAPVVNYSKNRKESIERFKKAKN
ncbi:MAG: deoxyribodipyrimidine photolyase [Magnetococcales bacterium]|nr:deoxyribodipyrimidine photolyase [Magnetococcales bacterium]|tara:strand:- start:38750 stop:40147 length:1398 start_codon:yes stop_codon:yes gene_type:complete